MSWYVSKNGADSPECGKNAESACATFPGLWRHLVRGSTSDNKVITNADLIIQDMHLNSPDQKFTFHNSASHVINITITNTTIEETFLEFNGHNISVRIENSLIRSSPIEFYGFSDSDQIVVVQNCTFDEVSAKKNSTSSVLKSGSLLSFNGTNVQLYSCNFTEIKHCSLSMFCLEGNVTMMDVVANGIEADFMNTKDCNVHMANSHFADNNGSRLISIDDGSFTMENSHFSNNTSKYNGIVFLNNSKARVINSTISGNKGDQAGGIDLIDSSVKMVSCILTRNRGFAGGIHLKGSSVRVINSTFSGNQGGRIGGIDVYKSKANVTDSTFTGNKGY